MGGNKNITSFETINSLHPWLQPDRLRNSTKAYWGNMMGIKKPPSKSQQNVTSATCETKLDNEWGMFHKVTFCWFCPILSSFVFFVALCRVFLHFLEFCRILLRLTLGGIQNINQNRTSFTYISKPSLVRC